MKKLLLAFSLVLLAFTAVSCNPIDFDNPPFYRVGCSYKVTESSDFSRIFNEVNPYINKNFSSESEAVSLYNDILGKTRDAAYTAPNNEYIQISITKYVAVKVSDNMVEYKVDASYKSPVGHIWDAKGSRDL